MPKEARTTVVGRSGKVAATPVSTEKRAQHSTSENTAKPVTITSVVPISHLPSCSTSGCTGCMPVFEDAEGNIVPPSTADLFSAALSETTEEASPSAVALFEMAIAQGTQEVKADSDSAPPRSILADGTLAFAKYMRLASLAEEAATHYASIPSEVEASYPGRVLALLYALTFNIESATVPSDKAKDFFSQISLVQGVISEIPHEAWVPEAITPRGARLLQVIDAISELVHVSRVADLPQLALDAYTSLTTVWKDVDEALLVPTVRLARGFALMEEASLRVGLAKADDTTEDDTTEAKAILNHGIHLVGGAISSDEEEDVPSPEQLSIDEKLGQGFVLLSALEEDDVAALEAYDNGVALLSHVYTQTDGENDELRDQLISLGVTEEELSAMLAETRKEGGEGEEE